MVASFFNTPFQPYVYQKGNALKKKGKGKAKVTKAIVKSLSQNLWNNSSLMLLLLHKSQMENEKKRRKLSFLNSRALGHWFENCKLYLEDLKKKEEAVRLLVWSHQK
ncbi:hypothetical protein Scep_014053 [Stephania cephalantha]|uniref:Uncharacterized protein n=1 Tax=Stephania cephalantha TaxID=152367 RepID=A0AAP0J2J7_9MAGN